MTIVKGRDEVHQTLIIPRLSVNRDKNREIFAVWAPYFNGESFSKGAIAKEFLTDAQGFELMERKVYNDEDEVDFASSFYPVDSVISVYNAKKTRALSVWNDRP